MVEVITWIWEMLSYLVESALSWKIFEEFSYLHLVLGLALLLMLLSFLTFGYVNSGGSADYIGAGLRAKRNEENWKDRQAYLQKEKDYRKTYDYYKENRLRKETYSNLYEMEMKSKK